MQITQDGVAVTNQFPETFAASSDPSVVNSDPPTNKVAIETSTVTNAVTIPGYSAELNMQLGWHGVARPVHHLHFEGGQLIVVVVH